MWVRFDGKLVLTPEASVYLVDFFGIDINVTQQEYAKPPDSW